VGIRASLRGGGGGGSDGGGGGGGGSSEEIHFPISAPRRETNTGC